ncbi:hypothetical protein [Spirosoma flavus]
MLGKSPVQMVIPLFWIRKQLKELAAIEIGCLLAIEQGITTLLVCIMYFQVAVDFQQYHWEKDLPEVERYVRQHRHSSGVLSVQYVVKQSSDVAKMDATLLVKSYSI